MKNTPDEVEKMEAAALIIYFRIANAWRLTDSEQRRLLGDPSPAKFLSWRRGESLPDREALQRIASVLGMYRCLHVLFPDADQADAWIRRPNSAAMFGGRSALDLMMSSGSDGVQLVLRYLDAQVWN